MAMRFFAPAVRALCERVRRPTSVQIILGAVLIAPAALIGRNLSAPATGLERQQLPPLVVDVSPEALKAASEPLALVAAQASEPSPQAGEDSTAAEAEATAAEATPVKYAQIYSISEPLARQIHKAAVANGIAPHTAFGLVRAESSFKTGAVSPVGAVGLTQIMPATARWLKPGTTRRDLMNPSFNLNLGFRYLRQLIDDYKGNERLALTAFNRGPGTVNSLLRRGRNPDNGYADKVLTGKSAKHVSLMNAKFRRKRT
jgi:soluble lytic murein transglycosylase-like protein